MTKRHLPCPTLVRLCFTYEAETGRLSRKPLPRGMYKSEAVRRKHKSGFGRYSDNTIGTWGYRRVKFLGHQIPAHRVVWCVLHGQWPDGFIDHINGNPADNVADNLRIVSPSGNMRNRKKQKNNKSGHTGVYFDKMCKSWAFEINGKKDRLCKAGFKSIEEAVTARDEIKLRLGYTERHGL